MYSLYMTSLWVYLWPLANSTPTPSGCDPVYPWGQGVQWNPGAVLTHLVLKERDWQASTEEDEDGRLKR